MVTGSGKTEIYMEPIEEALERVNRCVPPARNCPYSADHCRLQERFGDQVGIYHSRFNSSERVEIWQKVQQRQLAGY